MAMPEISHFGRRVGKYDVFSQLSTGGMAEIFLASTAGPGGFRKYVVLKRILPHMARNDEFVAMFLDEARITAQLAHPNIGQVFELGDDGGLYLAMEFVAGQNLAQVWTGCAARKQPLPVAFAVSVTKDVCAALHYAHTFIDPIGRPMPVIHRDVALKNVMVTYDGVVKLLDFGIAHVTSKLGSTRVGSVKGTTGYMSPEQVRGEALDGRSDVFCVGVMLHELLTGERLFEAENELREMEEILVAPIPRVERRNPLLSRELGDVVDQALARERANRFQSARDFGRALERSAGGLVMDREQIAAFMGELFNAKLRATRALLEAGGQGDDAGVRAAVRSLWRSEQLPHSATGSEEAIGGVNTVSGEAAAASVARPRGAGRRWVALGLGVGLVALATPLAIASLPGSPEERVDPATLEPVLLAPEAVFGPVRPLVPVPAAVADGPSPSPPPLKREPVRSGAKAMGRLTLVTHPASAVYVGERWLGATPLFKAELPAGTHLLTLVGPDGKVRRLSAPVRAGATTAFRLELADLPAE
jgi:eukaryotic-like serine/threonine-protein kinase